jgi:hypothetical protein
MFKRSRFENEIDDDYLSEEQYNIWKEDFNHMAQKKKKAKKKKRKSKKKKKK